MTSFAFHTTRSILVLAGATADLGRHAGRILGPRVLVVTDPGLRRVGLERAPVQSLQAAGHEVTLFDQVEPDPSLATLAAAVSAGRNAGVSGVLGLGGGSSLDVAKVAAFCLGSDQPLDQAWGVGQANGKRLPLVLVPTTAGTGSEVTPIAILTVEGSEKRGISSDILLPDLAILDADLTLGLPPAITAATGIDAMVHAIESYASANPNNNPLSRMLARQALTLLGAHIETAVHRGQDRPAREAMLFGAMLAGQAFANSPVAAVHALAYPVGGMFHVPHGLSNALLLTHVLRFNLPAAAEIYAEIAADAFPALSETVGPQRADAFIAALDDLIRRLDMPQRLRDVGIPHDALPSMAAAAMKQQRLLVNNPRSVTEADALSIYQHAW